VKSAEIWNVDAADGDATWLTDGYGQNSNLAVVDLVTTAALLVSRFTAARSLHEFFCLPPSYFVSFKALNTLFKLLFVLFRIQIHHKKWNLRRFLFHKKTDQFLFQFRQTGFDSASTFFSLKSQETRRQNTWRDMWTNAKHFFYLFVAFLVDSDTSAFCFVSARAKKISFRALPWPSDVPMFKMRRINSGKFLQNFCIRDPGSVFTKLLVNLLRSGPML
jgi:hypothetical protein